MKFWPESEDTIIMKKIDKDGLLLCELQAKAFELSISMTEMSSAIFIRRFMNSEAAKSMDSGFALSLNVQPADFLAMIEEQYGKSNYGTVKFSVNEMHWIGYIYRYFSYTYESSSARVYKIVKPNELRELFRPYHTMDSAQAIERILEAKGLSSALEMSIEKQYEIFKRIRMA